MPSIFINCFLVRDGTIEQSDSNGIRNFPPKDLLCIFELSKGSCLKYFCFEVKDLILLHRTKSVFFFKFHTGFTYLSNFGHVCTEVLGCFWITFKTKQRLDETKKKLLAGALGLTAQYQTSHWPKWRSSGARRAEMEKQSVGDTWWWGGQVFGAKQCAGMAFSVAQNKADLFIFIQRCKLLFIKLSHLASSEQNENPACLARTASKTHILCPLSAEKLAHFRWTARWAHIHLTESVLQTNWASKITHTHKPLWAQLSFL